MSGRSGTDICALGAHQSVMKRGRRLPYCLLLIAFLLGAAIIQKDGGKGFPTAKTRSNPQWARLYGALPLSFEANRGQTDPKVSFLSHGRGFTLFLAGRDAVLALKNLSAAPKGQIQETSETALRLRLLGANAHALATGKDELPGKVNYFIGNVPAKWRTNIPTYARVRYEGIYPGVDLVYYGSQGGELEYDFIVAPGADPASIALGIDAPGRSRLQIDPQGDLMVHLSKGDLRLHKPVVYQVRTAVQGAESGVGNRKAKVESRRFIEGNYALDAQNHLHFRLGPYDHNRPLVIDPVLSYATYVGGTGGDIAYAIGVDTNLDAYITGVTNSTNFPTAGSPYQSSSKGDGDCFVTKINSSGTALIYSTYIGGSGNDQATALALSSGSVFITGYTTSSDFPLKSPPSTVTTEPFQDTYGGNTDAFVTELDTTGQALVYSSYLGGSGQDEGQGIAVDSSGNAYVTGSTQSTNFPVVSPLQPALSGSQNAFVTKVNVSGEALVYSTYLGGAGPDSGQSIQVDSSGNAYVTGYTSSSNFPTVNPYQSALAGPTNAFLSEVNAAGSALTFSTFLGGSGTDRAYGLALDGSNNIYITGVTTSLDFPLSSGAVQAYEAGSSDVFVSKFNNAGSSLVYSTYLGGSGADQGNAIAVTSAGIAYVTGFTQSSNFPILNPIQSVLGISNNTYCGANPCPDAFVAQLNSSGTALTYSTYLGGNSYDTGQGIALDSTSDPYITGTTVSTNFPVTRPPQSSATYVPPYQGALAGTAGNAYIAKIDSGDNPNISIQPDTVDFGNETINVASTAQEVYIVNPSTEPLIITAVQVPEIDNSYTVYTETDNCIGTISPGSAYCTMYITYTPNGTGSQSSTITLTDNAGGVAGTQQTITVSGTGVTATTTATLVPTSLSFTTTGVGSVSAAQNVSLTNTGTEPLSISSISVGTSLDFAETNTCLVAPYSGVLQVNQSCTISVTFSPTASGTRTASLSITDTATGSPQTVSLTGIGGAAFTLSSPSAVNPTLIGSDQTTFQIVANGPTSFNGAISLACSAPNTCTFTTNPIFIGTVTTMTIDNLTTSMANPYIFTVTGTSGSQSATLQLSLGFEDYTLTASPSSVVVQAGTTASYTVLVNPLNDFSQQVLLQCTGSVPPDTTCNFYPSNKPTPNGLSPTSVNLQITTQKYIPTTTPTHLPPWFPRGKLPPFILGLLTLAALASLALGRKPRAGQSRLVSAWLGLRLAAISLILALDLALVACRANTLVISGTTVGNYVVTISGTLVSNTNVIRATTVDLSVTQSPVP